MPQDAHSPTGPVVVAGMHRSGTSLVASTVAAGGVNMGDRVLAADRANRHGYVEDLDVLALDREILAATTPVDDGGHPDWGWTEHDRRSDDGVAAFAGRARDLVDAKAAAGGRWGWKDPRTTLLLDFWHPLLPDPRYVLVYRSPWDVADSLQRLGADVFARNPGYGLAIWTAYNRRLLDFHRRHPGRCLLVGLEALLDDPSRYRALLRERTGVAVTDARLRATLDEDALRRTPPGDPLAALVTAVHPEVGALLRDLDAAADLAPRRTVDASPLVAVPDAPRLAVVIPCFNQGDTVVEAVASARREGDAVEVVVVDDGSDDPGTLRVLDALRAEGVAVHRQENAGVAAARNAGVARTEAPAILPLDADNRLHPGFVPRALAVLDAHPRVGVVYGDRVEFGLRDAAVDVPPFDLPTLLAYNVIDACAVVRRTTWDEAGGHDPHAPVAGWEDWDFWLSVAQRGWHFHHEPVAGFDYRVRPDSMIAGTAGDDARRRLYDHVIGRHRPLYDEHLPEVLMHGQHAATELFAAARELEGVHATLLARDEELRRLHGEVEAREERLGWLHGEVAVRDEEIRRLHREVALRDAQIRELTAGDGAPS